MHAWIILENIKIHLRLHNQADFSFVQIIETEGLSYNVFVKSGICLLALCILKFLNLRI